MASRTKKPARPVIETRLAYAGITLAARSIGCSREHLSKVLHGKRQANPKIARTLRRMGITTTVDGEEL